MEIDPKIVHTDSSGETPEPDPVGKLEEEALRRKERLRALRQKLQGGPDDSDAMDQGETHIALPHPKFRSYNPSDTGFQETARPKAPVLDIEQQIQDTLAQGQIQTLLEDVELTNLAPRKPDWDLKRDVAPKIAKLERRTQRAIAELILERLQETQVQEIPLAASVNFSTSSVAGAGAQ